MTIENIEKVLGELNALECKTEKEVEEARVRFLGKKGEITALFGPTGSGKTTILSLICRNYDIQKGQILIDGKEVVIRDPKDHL